MKTIYYRLLCLQTGNVMATGYNSKSKKELTDAYANYKQNDWIDDLKPSWDKMSIDDKIDFILNDDFKIDSSYTEFINI